MTRFPQIFQDMQMWEFTMVLFVIMKQTNKNPTKQQQKCQTTTVEVGGPMVGPPVTHNSPIQIKGSDEDVLQYIE